MVNLSICRPFSSPWASPLHVVQKLDGPWRCVGDYREINTATVQYSYHVPHIHNFALSLAGTILIYSRLDLVPVLLVKEEDMKKTAVITPFGRGVKLMVTGLSLANGF